MSGGPEPRAWRIEARQGVELGSAERRRLDDHDPRIAIWSDLATLLDLPAKLRLHEVCLAESMSGAKQSTRVIRGPLANP
jgi:hypothetical protein